MIKLGILGSTKGSDVPPIADAIIAGELDASIEIIITNNKDHNNWKNNNNIIKVQHNKKHSILILDSFVVRTFTEGSLLSVEFVND